MKARITVTLKTGVHDPQGHAIEGAIAALGIDGVENVRQGKIIELEMKGSDRAKAEAQIERMCKELLSNPVIESYRYEIAG